MDNYKICGCFSRKFKKEELNPPMDIIESFKSYVESGTYMAPEQLQKFMVEVQGETMATVADAEKIVEDIMRLKHPHISIFSTIIRKSLSIDDFFFYLFSVDLNPPIKSQVYQAMTSPLSHYFIYTGHNSYLTGNQLSSDCSDIPIIQALQRGVRVIELDLWPTPSKEDVHVLHGKTLTNPVELVKCLKAIKNDAFSASPYPVILTLEDHLNPKLQAIVAQMITRELGDMLFYPEKEISQDFPSPEELKYKVIISTKPPKEYLSAEVSINEGKESQKEQPSSEVEQTSIDNNEINDDKLKENVDADVYEDEYISEYDAMHEEPPAYKNLITIPGIKRGKLKESLKVDTNKLSRLSLNEQILAKAITSYGTDIVRYTQKNILRIYPKATRVDSSNYQPLVGWMHGAQMVAFNMQGYGKPLWLMQGLFRANGGCGYVKKPDFLLNLSPDNQVFDPKADLPIKITLKVKVYMGVGWDVDFKRTHFDFYSPPDFYVRVGIAGAPKDETMKKTKVIENRWIPAWDEDFSFPLTIPELALLRVEAHEHDTSEKDDFAGQTCLPVSELKPGFHAVPLYNFEGDKYTSVKLLMKFMFV
ncbi:phosphoinositide phospholipase C 4-like [Silene latifolia]|uniref:phosphoinositide phospholipase C 4-like n=1 Tax=Silene latifolia TaxID=37657 RepID=UPI003D77DB9B